MRAMAVTAFDAPLELLDLPRPKREPGFVVIRVLACGVCYTDYKTIHGRLPWSATLHLPHVPGHEVVGEVAEAGPETGFERGTRVVVYNYWSCGKCAYCRMGLENLCDHLTGQVGFISPGGFEEYLAIPAERLLRLPEGIDPVEAAPSSCALGTSYRAIVTRGQVQAGQTVVVLGTGGVGLNCVQVAAAAGARVLAVDIAPRHLAAAKKLGAREGAAAGDAALAMVKDFTQGLGADLVVNTVGHEQTYHQSAMLARRGGRVVGVGYVVNGMAPIQTDDMVLREIEFIGSRYVQRHELERALQLLATGQVKNVVDDVLPLEEANQAFERLEQGKVVGRTVLKVAN